MITSSINVDNVGISCLRLKPIYHIPLAYTVGMLTGATPLYIVTSKIKVYIYCLHYIYILSNPYYTYIISVGISCLQLPTVLSCLKYYKKLN